MASSAATPARAAAPSRGDGITRRNPTTAKAIRAISPTDAPLRAHLRGDGDDAGGRREREKEPRAEKAETRRAPERHDRQREQRAKEHHLRPYRTHCQRQRPSVIQTRARAQTATGFTDHLQEAQRGAVGAVGQDSDVSCCVGSWHGALPVEAGEHRQNSAGRRFAPSSTYASGGRNDSARYGSGALGGSDGERLRGAAVGGAGVGPPRRGSAVN